MNMLDAFRKRITRKDESGNSFLMYLLLMPVLVATMGFGMDISINTYTQNTLQSSLDQATQSSVSLARNPDVTSNTVSLYEELRQQVRNIYDANRMGKLANLACQGERGRAWYQGELGGEQVTPPSGCGYTEVSVNITLGGGGSYREQYLTAEVVEYSKNSFMAMFGIPYQEYHIRSEAVITQAND